MVKKFRCKVLIYHCSSAQIQSLIDLLFDSEWMLICGTVGITYMEFPHAYSFTFVEDEGLLLGVRYVQVDRSWFGLSFLIELID